jgi:thioredoxin 1
MESKVKAEETVLSSTDQTFPEDVLNALTPVLVDFWAPWCGPCRMIAPAVEELGREFASRARVVKLNVDENPATAARYGIASIPTLLVFKNGKVVDQVIGAASKRTIAARLESQLN